MSLDATRVRAVMQKEFRATIAAYSVIGEREQGSLEPVLTTPIRREELVLGKALAALVPSVAIAYVVFGIFLLCVRMFAHPTIASAVFHGPQVVAQLLFTPLLATWSIWVGIAVSVRSSDVRAATQLGTLAGLPPLALTSLMSFGVIQPTLTLTLVLAAVLALVDVSAWRVVSSMFDRERLITGSRLSAKTSTSP